MNGTMKRRMLAVAGVVVMTLVVALAVIGGGTSATVLSVAQAAEGDWQGKKIQVTGAVVDNSYVIDADGSLSFDLRDEEAAAGDTVHVVYDQGVSATFGNGVTAVCTGRMDDAGVLVASELVTKCPSKYESAQDALGVEQLLGYGEAMMGKTVKVSGVLSAEGLQDASAQVRFTVLDAEGVAGESDASDGVSAGSAGAAGGAAALPVVFKGALPDELQSSGAVIVVTGALDEDGRLLATDVALEG